MSKNKFSVIMCALWNTITSPVASVFDHFTNKDAMEFYKIFVLAALATVFIFTIPVVPELILMGFFLYLRRKEDYDPYLEKIYIASNIAYFLVVYPIIHSSIISGSPHHDPIMMDIFMGNTISILVSIVLPHIIYQSFMFIITAVKYIWTTSKSKFEENMEICSKK